MRGFSDAIRYLEIMKDLRNMYEQSRQICLVENSEGCNELFRQITSILQRMDSWAIIEPDREILQSCFSLGPANARIQFIQAVPCLYYLN
jgi:hypothetical protein